MNDRVSDGASIPVKITDPFAEVRTCTQQSAAADRDSSMGLRATEYAAALDPVLTADRTGTGGDVVTVTEGEVLDEAFGAVAEAGAPEVALAWTGVAL